MKLAPAVLRTAALVLIWLAVAQSAPIEAKPAEKAWAGRIVIPCSPFDKVILDFDPNAKTREFAMIGEARARQPGWKLTLDEMIKPKLDEKRDANERPLFIARVTAAPSDNPDDAKRIDAHQMSVRMPLGPLSAGYYAIQVDWRDENGEYKPRTVIDLKLEPKPVSTQEKSQDKEPPKEAELVASHSDCNNPQNAPSYSHVDRFKADKNVPSGFKSSIRVGSKRNETLTVKKCTAKDGVISLTVERKADKDAGDDYEQQHVEFELASLKVGGYRVEVRHNGEKSVPFSFIIEALPPEKAEKPPGGNPKNK